jgi:hypothetical protein
MCKKVGTPLVDRKHLIGKALQYRDYAARKSNAYYAAAKYYHRWHLVLGAAGASGSALVGTAVFVAVAKGEYSPLTSLQAESRAALSMLVIIIALITPVLTALHTFLRYSDVAERCRATATKYDVLRQRLDVYLLRYSSVNRDEPNTALEDFDQIVSEFSRLAENSLSIPDRFWDKTKDIRVTDDVTAQAGTNSTTGAA